MRRAVPDWWGSLVHGYFGFLSRRGRRPNTLRAYRSELDDFGSWLIEQGVTGLSGLQRGHIEGWQDELRERKELSTQMVAASVVRGLLKWAIAQGVIGIHPTLWLGVVTPYVPPGTPRPIPRADLEIVRRELDLADREDIWQLRTRALFCLIFSSGCRISEALSLGRHALVDGACVVVQKGGRTHTIVISKPAHQAIIDLESQRLDKAPWLFASLKAGHREDRLGWDEAQEGWDRLCRLTGVPRFKSHQIRHSCATEMLRRHVDHVTIAKHMGHRGLQTLQTYAEVAMDARREAVASLELAG